MCWPGTMENHNNQPGKKSNHHCGHLYSAVMPASILTQNQTYCKAECIVVRERQVYFSAIWSKKLYFDEMLWWKLIEKTIAKLYEDILHVFLGFVCWTVDCNFHFEIRVCDFWSHIASFFSFSEKIFSGYNSSALLKLVNLREKNFKC